jgi:predicted DCC family thiol-disulfide oxidoreductase YuxK
MADSTKFPLTVYYDGSCAICSREMLVYQRRESDRLVFYDISAPGFDAIDHGGTLDAFMKELHVRDAAGQFHTGISAFARIWSAFPESPLYSLLERTINLPGIRQGADLSYATFARFRHLLPKNSCHGGSCKLH